ncbi:MAG TPA: hypothetical protein VIH57_09900 [Bacteroidales bacterium]
MPPAITLTKDQIDQILLDMGKSQLEMLTDAEVNALAQKVNEKINLPFLSEEKELIVFAKIIKWIDRELYKVLPNEYYKLIRDSTDGISPEEAKAIEDRLAALLNKVINIPVLPEKLEEEVIRFVLHLIISAMIKGLKLEEQPVK